jgi:TonB-linked SusC/RagA family outer membrane protein
MKRILQTCFLFLLVLSSIASNAQDKKITGKVTSSDDGLPLPGVSVKVTGSNLGTQTDVNGNYSILVPTTAKSLQISFIGFVSQTVSVLNKTVINVSIETDSKQLTEVVVTGYGVAQKRDIAASSARVDGKQIENLPIQSFDRALQGRAAGVQVTSQSGAPGSAINVRVRGVGSINAGNDPLYIIDGVQVNVGAVSGQGSSNTLASINPNDIESIEVLKDAAAASIYGSAAANGVVLITTKKGKAGATQVNFSAQRGATTNFARYDVMNTQQYSRFKYDGAINAGSTPTTAIALYGDPVNNTTPTTDWFDAITRTGDAKLYDLSISGGDAKTTFYVSGSYTDQESQVIQSFYKRGTFRANLGHQITDKLSVKASVGLTATKLFGSIENGNFVNGPFAFPFSLRPDVPIFQPDGSYTQGAALRASFPYNIVQGAYEEVRLGNALQTVSNFTASYKITSALTLTGFAGIDFVDTRDDNQRPATIPAFAGNGGTSTVINTRGLDFNTNVTANYNRKFGKHTVAALLGGEYKEQNTESATAQGSSFPNPLFRSLQNASPLSVAGFFTGYKKQGVFSKVNYDFNDKYYGSATIRYDGSSRFGADKQYGLFGAVSGVWRVTGENFMKNVKFINDLKLRVSYGVVGNDQIDNFASRALFGAGGRYLSANGIRPSQLGNASLGWEEATTTNLGLDFGIFNDRLSGSIDVYRRVNSSLLLNRPLVSDSGFGGINQNAGSIQNEGIELNLNSVNLDTKFGLKWTSNFNIAFQRNKILELIDGQTNINNTLVVGQPRDIIYTYSWAGVNPADGRPMWYDANGNYTYNVVLAADQKIQGTRYPKFVGGFNNTFNYKGVTLDFLFNYQYGNKQFVSFFQSLWNSGYTEDNQIASQLGAQWTTPGQITEVPRVLRNSPHPNNVGGLSTPLTTASSRYLFDASYIRLKNVTLSYDLPKSIISKAKLRSVRVFTTGINLLTFTKYPGLDPEIPIGFNEAGNNPQARTITGGLQIGL